MTKYNDVEIQTAKNLLKNGYKWIVRNRTGKLLAYHSKPSNMGRLWLSDDDDYGYYFCEVVPIFQSIHFGDKEPVSLESIVHPQILDDAERRYLKGVIRPFRKYVISIRLQDVGVTSNQRVTVFYNDYVFGRSSFALPTFKKGTMYKGMEVGRKYTPEELGL